MAVVKEVKDMALATFIFCLDEAELIYPKPKGKTIFFVFKIDMAEDEFSKLLSDYYNGKTLVDPRRYAEKQERLRDIIGMFRCSEVKLNKDS